eukprot:5884102-Prymnesium_polylepis.1
MAETLGKLRDIGWGNYLTMSGIETDHMKSEVRAAGKRSAMTSKFPNNRLVAASGFFVDGPTEGDGNELASKVKPYVVDWRVFAIKSNAGGDLTKDVDLFGNKGTFRLPLLYPHPRTLKSTAVAKKQKADGEESKEPSSKLVDGGIHPLRQGQQTGTLVLGE